MNKTDKLYKTYIDILEKELIPAMGCTEPIAVAFCAAKAREVLGEMPDKTLIEVSGNIIKNVKSVIVPNTNGKKGIDTAVAIGLIAGDSSLDLQVISKVTEEQKSMLEPFMSNKSIEIKPLDSKYALDIKVTVYKDGHDAMVHIVNDHTNIVEITKDSQRLLHVDIEDNREEEHEEYTSLTVEKIYDFATTVEIEDVKELLDMQIENNLNISQEGLDGNYGANIGSVLSKTYGDTIENRAKARAAAGSDARMNGCELPVVINSGSGNQGLTVSMPVYEYAKELKVSDEKLYRALIISNLCAIHIKTEIGRLSAYCGAVSAGACAGAAIAYLRGGNLRAISHTMVNSLAITSGIICDGAKASCAAKIAFAVESGIFGYEMFLNDQQFYGGDGIISKGVENTIRNIGILGSEGMYQTDKEIIKIMTCVD